MQLTPDQERAVRKWAGEEGCTLSKIQKQLNTEFGLSLTYMDARFLVIDLGIVLQDKKEPRKAVKEELVESAPPDDLPGGGGGVAVELDAIMKPGALVSGSVTFSDGARASWSLDQMGRLALQASTPGYRPPEQDLQEFQTQLSAALQRRGF